MKKLLKPIQGLFENCFPAKGGISETQKFFGTFKIHQFFSKFIEKLYSTFLLFACTFQELDNKY